MFVLVEAGARPLQKCNLPQCLDPFVLSARQSAERALTDRLAPPLGQPPVDPTYDVVVDLGPVELLAEAQPLLAALRDGVRRRHAHPIAENETLSLG